MARALQQHTLASRRRVLGEEHPDTTVSAWNLLTMLVLNDLVAAHALVEADLQWLLRRDARSLSGDQQEIRRMLAEFLAQTASASPPDPVAHMPTTIEVDPRHLYVATGIIVQPGQRYSFSASGNWKDASTICDHRGWGGGWLTRFARVSGQPFFRLCASIGKDDRTAFAVDTAQPWTVPDTLPSDGDHQLMLFANDLRWMYWNNHALSAAEGGPLRVTITRLG